MIPSHWKNNKDGQGVMTEITAVSISLVSHRQMKALLKLTDSTMLRDQTAYNAEA